MGGEKMLNAKSYGIYFLDIKLIVFISWNHKKMNLGFEKP